MPDVNRKRRAPGALGTVFKTVRRGTRVAISVEARGADRIECARIVRELLETAAGWLDEQPQLEPNGGSTTALWSNSEGDETDGGTL